MDPKPIKLEKKANKKKEYRRKALLDQGISEEDVDNFLAQEEYNNLPIDQKITRLEHMLSISVQNMAKDMGALQHNDRVIADAFDANYRAIAMMFEKLGITREQQLEFMKAASESIIAEQKKDQPTELTKEEIEKELAKS